MLIAAKRNFGPVLENHVMYLAPFWKYKSKPNYPFTDSFLISMVPNSMTALKSSIFINLASCWFMRSKSWSFHMEVLMSFHQWLPLNKTEKLNLHLFTLFIREVQILVFSNQIFLKNFQLVLSQCIYKKVDSWHHFGITLKILYK